MAASAIVVPFADLEPLVGRWRRAHTNDGAEGMPAHVTLIYPFVDDARLDDEVIAGLHDTLAAFTPFDVRFAAFGTFAADPPVLYLEPRPGAPFLELMTAIAARLPDHPPFGGVHETIVPHLTLVETADAAAIEAAKRRLAPSLPLVTRAGEVHVMVHHAREGWHTHAAITLG